MVRRLGALALPAGIVALSLLLLPSASAGPGATFRVSVATGGAEGNGRSFVPADSAGAEANDDSFAPVVSDNGRFVAFSSAASNLVEGDTNGVDDVFVRDRGPATTT